MVKAAAVCRETGGPLADQPLWAFAGRVLAARCWALTAEGQPQSWARAAVRAPGAVLLRLSVACFLGGIRPPPLPLSQLSQLQPPRCTSWGVRCSTSLASRLCCAPFSFPRVVALSRSYFVLLFSPRPLLLPVSKANNRPFPRAVGACLSRSLTVS